MEFATSGEIYQKIVHIKHVQIFLKNLILENFYSSVKGLKVLLDLKILHRDMKSANVFLFNNRAIK